MKKTFNFEEIKHKRPAPGRQNSSSYRIFGEQAADPENTPFHHAQPRPAPFYTEPNANAMPVQEVEPRNYSYGGRQGDIQPTNIGRSNGGSGPMRAGNIEREDSRWWDWSQANGNQSRSAPRAHDERMNTRGNSYQNVFNNGTEDTATYTRQNSRYSASPKQTRTVGIVPITNLKSADHEFDDQRLNGKAQYEQHYVSQTQLDYPRREPQYEAAPNEMIQPPPKPADRSRAVPSAKVERASSMWDLFHPHNGTHEQAPVHSRKYQRPLPEIKRTEKYDGAWPNDAPYAADYHLNREFYQAPIINQANGD